MIEEQLFHQALEQPEEARAAFLDAACQGDAGLRERVETLLRAHLNPGSFLASPPCDVAPPFAPPRLEQPGTQIGPYKLLEIIGEGGMGVVYYASQREPIRRTVALKIIKPGMDTREVVKRFEAERQALAMMDHPNIAKVLDAGATDTGRPYFAMELVKGKPINQFCDREQLTTRERLALFVNICHGVQHAHQKGVIHRDLKPSNLLIEVHDVRPVPKIIDFGIAKAVGQQLTDQSLHTGVSQMVGTPLYMSPEQAGQSSLDVDTRSDVYSLGVVLYELLTGTTPFERDTLQQAGHDELRRLICEVDPPRPSARVSTLQAADLSTISDSRKVEPRKLSQQLRGELDWIVMRALDKDRDRRYESASALAEDIERYLRDEPVLAGPPSTAYRLRKFARRNKRALLTAAAGVLVMLLGVGAGGGSAGYFLRDREVRLAETQRAAESALNEANSFEQQGKWSAALGAAQRAQAFADSQTGNEELHVRVQQRIKDLSMVLRVEEIRLEASAEVWNDAFDWSLGDRLYAQAFRDYGIDVEALQPEEIAQRMPTGAARNEMATALDDWARLRRNIRKTDTRDWKHFVAAARATDADSWRNRLREAWMTDDRKTAQELLKSVPRENLHPFQVLLTQFLLSRDEYLALLRDAQFRHPGDFWLNQELASSLYESESGDARDALRFCQAALALRPESPGVCQNLATTLFKLDRYGEAIAVYERAIQIKPDYAGAYDGLARAFTKLGRHDEAIAACERAIQIKPDYARAASAYCSLGQALIHQGAWDKAETALRGAIRLNPRLMEAHNNLGLVLDEKGDLVGSEEALRMAIRIDPNCAAAHSNLGGLLKNKGDLIGAEEALRTAIRIDPNYASAHYNLGNTLIHSGRWEAAETELREAIRLNPRYTEAYCNLGAVLAQKGDLENAEEAHRTAVRIDPNHAQAYSGLGAFLCDSRQDYDGAIAAFRRAIELGLMDGRAHYNLGNALREKGELNEAITAYRQAIAFDPKNGKYHYILADTLWRAGKNVDAIETLQTAIKLQPNLAAAHYALGRALFDNGDLDGAIHHYQQASHFQPDDFNAYHSLFIALARQESWDAAVAAARDAIRCKPDSAEAHCNLGRSLQKTGQLRDALEALQRGHELGSKDPNWQYPSAQWVQECQELLKESEAKQVPQDVPPPAEPPRAPAGKVEETPK